MVIDNHTQQNTKGTLVNGNPSFRIGMAMAHWVRQSGARYPLLALLLLLVACSGLPTATTPGAPTPGPASPQAAQSTTTRATRPDTPATASATRQAPGPAPATPPARPTSTPSPSPPPAWQPAGDLTIGRQGHTATLLPDGSVLVVGGYGARGTGVDDGPTTPSAERFDPASGTWRAAGSLLVGRQGHTATPLPDGTVLVVGGYGDDGPLASAEIYDPRRDRWTVTGDLLAARGEHTATLLADGSVLVAGGYAIPPEADPDYEDYGIAVTATAERYDPVGRRWQAVGEMTIPRMEHSATLLPGGDVLVVGGRNYEEEDDTGETAERFSAATGQWRAIAPPGVGRHGHTATLLIDGTVLVAGGEARPIERFDPGTNTWRAAGTLTTTRAYHTATLLPSGLVLFAGGSDMGRLGVLGRAEIFQPSTDLTFVAADLIVPRLAPTATLLGDGSVLLVGGSGRSVGGVPTLASTERYRPGPAPLPRAPESREYLANFLLWPVMPTVPNMRAGFDRETKGYRVRIPDGAASTGNIILAPEGATFENFTLEIDVDVRSGTTGYYGVAFRTQDATRRQLHFGANYLFYITPAGAFGLAQVDGQGASRLIQPSVFSGAIVPGASKNRLRVTAQGETLTFAINGKPVGRYTATIRAAGQVGIYYASDGGAGATDVIFSDLRVVPTP